jgi:hypothetical protein
VTADRSYVLRLAILSLSLSLAGGAGTDSCFVEKEARDESGENFEIRSALGRGLNALGAGLLRLAIASGATEGRGGMGGSGRAVLLLSVSELSRGSPSTHNAGETASVLRAISGTASPLFTLFRFNDLDGYSCLEPEGPSCGDKID